MSYQICQIDRKFDRPRATSRQFGTECLLAKPGVAHVPEGCSIRSGLLLVLHATQPIRSPKCRYAAAECNVYIQECEDLIQIEAEELEALVGADYSDLAPELRLWVRARTIEFLWPDYSPQKSMAVA